MPREASSLQPRSASQRSRLCSSCAAVMLPCPFLSLCTAKQRLILRPAQKARTLTGRLAACRPSYSIDARQCRMADSYACGRMQPDIGDGSRGWCVCGRGRVWKSAATGCARVGPWNAASRPEDLLNLSTLMPFEWVAACACYRAATCLAVA